MSLGLAVDAKTYITSRGADIVTEAGHTRAAPSDYTQTPTGSTGRSSPAGL
jgi:hypothetical protein